MKRLVRNDWQVSVAESLSGSIKYIYGAIMVLIVGVCLFGSHIQFSYKKNMEYANWQYLLTGVFLIGVFFLLTAAVDKKLAGKTWLKQGQQNKLRKLWMLGMSLLFFAGLVFSSYHYYFKTGWDAQTVEGTASMIAAGLYKEAQNKYFSYYPNNVFLTFLFSVVAKLGYGVGINNYYFCIIVFQCFLFAAAGFLVYCAAEKLLNAVWAVGIWILYVLFVGISPWVVIPYSDATGIIFPILVFYLSLCVKDGKHIGLSLMLLTLVSYIGYRIKPQILIMPIGIAIVAVLEFAKAHGSRRKQWLKRLIWPLLGFIAGMGIVTAGVKATRLQIDDGLVFSIPHYLMMGMNDEANGVINLEDQNFSMSFSTAEERTRANLQVAAERIKEMGLPGLAQLWTKKILTNFSDGTFAWWEEGQFYSQEMYDGNYLLRSLLSSFYYEHGSRYSLFVNYMQTLWMGILLLGAAASLKKKQYAAGNVLMLSIVGLFLFETIFEARARYLFIYAPVFVLQAGMGFRQILCICSGLSNIQSGLAEIFRKAIESSKLFRELSKQAIAHLKQEKVATCKKLGYYKGKKQKII